MKSIIEKISPSIKHVLNGFDRLVFKGHLLPLLNETNIPVWLSRRGVLIKDFKPWMMAQTERIVQRAEDWAKGATGAPILRLLRDDRKEEVAHNHQKERGMDSGLIGVYSAVENCQSYRSTFQPGASRPAIRKIPTKCKHLYFYFDHPVFGFMSTRLQTWFPYSIQIQMNGREWLRRSLEKENIEFLRRRNKFFYIEDWDRAQAILNEQVPFLWPDVLNQILLTVFPDKRTIVGPDPDYYWTVWQSEWASDLIFDDTKELQDIAMSVMKHAFMIGTPERVFRYLDRPLTQKGKIDGRCKDEVTTTILKLSEEQTDGCRIRHYVGSNSVKLYCEQNILRVETTINKPGAYKAYRHKQGASADAPKELQPLRKTVADTALRAQISQDVNDRFIEGLSTLKDTESVGQLFDRLCHSRMIRGHRVRGLDPTGKDLAILKILSDPAFAVSGITNRAIREKLVSSGQSGKRNQNQLSGYVSRQIRFLRDLKLLHKQRNQHAYRLSPLGQQLVTTVNAVYNASIKGLMETSV